MLHHHCEFIEKITTQPIEGINEVFDQASLSDLIDNLLHNWLRVTVINTQNPYSHRNGRELLYAFNEQLTQFVAHLIYRVGEPAIDDTFTALHRYLPPMPYRLPATRTGRFLRKPALVTMAPTPTASRPDVLNTLNQQPDDITKLRLWAYRRALPPRRHIGKLLNAIDFMLRKERNDLPLARQILIIRLDFS